MKITYIGHACFTIEKNGYKVILDPYEDGYVPGFGPLREEADLVLCSHQHGDHNAESVVTLRTGAECPFEITRIETYHDDCHGAERGMNTIHILDDGVNKVAHLGDLGCNINEDMSEADIAALTDLDAILIPVGGTFTIDTPQAIDLIKQLNPRIAIPMHFRSDYYQFGFDVLTTDDYFVESCGEVLKKYSYSIETEENQLTRVIMLRAEKSIKQK